MLTPVILALLHVHLGLSMVDHIFGQIILKGNSVVEKIETICLQQKSYCISNIVLQKPLSLLFNQIV